MRLLFRGCAVNNDAIKWATTVFLILLSNLVNVKAYATTNDFFVVSGQFGGDPWKEWRSFHYVSIILFFYFHFKTIVQEQ